MKIAKKALKTLLLSLIAVSCSNQDEETSRLAVGVEGIEQTSSSTELLQGVYSQALRAESAAIEISKCSISRDKAIADRPVKGTCDDLVQKGGVLIIPDRKRAQIDLTFAKPLIVKSVSLRVAKAITGKIYDSEGGRVVSFNEKLLRAGALNNLALEKPRLVSGIRIALNTYDSNSEAAVDQVMINGSIINVRSAKGPAVVVDPKPTPAPAPTPAPTPTPAPAPAPAPAPSQPTPTSCNSYGSPTEVVNTTEDLNRAIAAAKPGAHIRLKAGTYTGPIVWRGLVGTSQQPIVISGESGVLLSNRSVSADRILTIQDSSYLAVCGFEISTGQKGLMAENVDHSIFSFLKIHNIGHEGFHLKFGSSFNTLSNSRIYDAGVTDPGIGEAVYIGSHHTTPYRPAGSSSSGSYEDYSNDNRIFRNVFGPDIRAEHIDVKQYTQRTIIEANTFDGNGIVGENYADSWVDIKGSFVKVFGNVGSGGPGNGFEVHDLTPGDGDDSGAYNEFSNNSGSVASGKELINVSGKRKDTNLVDCSNNSIVMGRAVSNMCPN